MTAGRPERDVPSERDVRPEDAVAAFDSASALLGGLAAALGGRTFPHVGSPRAQALAVRAASRLPWPALREVYTRSGAAEAIAPDRVGDVDADAVAAWLAGRHPRRRYPAALVGASNGALTHLAAAAQVPWLPTTVLLPVERTGDPDRPVDALRFGERTAGPLLERNPEIVLHHMHDQLQDRLMVARMTYFRWKWRVLPAAYRAFLESSLAPGAPVVVVEDCSTWPVTRVGERHVFQAGAQGGRDPQWYAERSATPQPDDVAPEAEWGVHPALVRSVQKWGAATGHPVVRLRFEGPQRPSHAVACVLREWFRGRGEPGDRLVVPSFVLADPWATLRAAATPYWTFFPVQAALAGLDEHLARADRYREVDVLLFNHGVDSAGAAGPREWLDVVRRHGARGRLLAVDPRRFPRDIGSLARYGPALAGLPPARRPWSPLDVDAALDGLRRHGLAPDAGRAGSAGPDPEARRS